METTHSDIQNLATEAQAFCNRWFHNAPGPRLLVVVGPTGNGKTHLARRVWGWASTVAFERWSNLRCATDSLPTVKFAEWARKAEPPRTPEPEFDVWIREAEAASLFVLDDIGTETDVFRSGAPTARLCEFLNRRANQFTLITTNVPFEDNGWRKRWDARVDDRLLRNSTVCSVQAPSFTLWKE